jgi:hypothetical protein
LQKLYLPLNSLKGFIYSTKTSTHKRKEELDVYRALGNTVQDRSDGKFQQGMEGDPIRMAMCHIWVIADPRCSRLATHFPVIISA